MHWSTAVPSVLALAAHAAAQGVLTLPPAGAACVLQGPAYAPPSQATLQKTVAAAAKQFEAAIADPSNGMKSNNTAWTLALFSSTGQILYDHFDQPPINISVPTLDLNSVFRLASVTKVLTVWTLLAVAGEKVLYDKITKYVPELNFLKPVVPAGAVYDDINSVRWDDITLGELASQASGIAFDVVLGELGPALPPQIIEASGLPTLNSSDIAVCGVQPGMPPCTRKQFFQYLAKKAPTFANSHSPAYSNNADVLISYALETMTGLPFETLMERTLFQKLGLKSASYSKVPANGVITRDPTLAGWNFNVGSQSPAGSVYMSTGDLVTAVQAIMSSKLVSPDVTRRWLKPRIQTGYAGASVGLPWEITTLQLSNNHVTQVFEKDGDIIDYHSSIGILPDYDVGYVFLTSGVDGTLIRQNVKDNFGQIFIEALENGAEADSDARFSGTYTDAATGSVLTLVAGDQGVAGLHITSLISRKVPLIGPGAPPNVFELGNQTYLFPSGLQTLSKGSAGNYISRLGYHGTFVPQLEPGVITDPCESAWTQVGVPTYGFKASTDFVFSLSALGSVQSVELRAFDLVLNKVA